MNYLLGLVAVCVIGSVVYLAVFEDIKPEEISVDAEGGLKVRFKREDSNSNPDQDNESKSETVQIETSPQPVASTPTPRSTPEKSEEDIRNIPISDFEASKKIGFRNHPKYTGIDDMGKAVCNDNKALRQGIVNLSNNWKQSINRYCTKEKFHPKEYRILKSPNIDDIDTVKVSEPLNAIGYVTIKNLKFYITQSTYERPNNPRFIYIPE